MKKMMKKQEGFTLIELIIVIAILAIIAAVAIPNVLGAVENSRKSTDVTNAKMILDAAAMVQAKNDIAMPTSDIDLKTVDSASSGFSGHLYDELSKNIPTPKFTQGGIDRFVLKVNSTDKTYQVAVKAGADGAETVLAPNAPLSYTTQN